MCDRYRRFHSEFLALSQDDRDKAIWQYLRDRQTCPHCGTRGPEWDPDAGGHRRAYVAALMDCAGCVVRLRGERDYQHDLETFPGSRVGLVRNPELEAW